MSHPDRSLGGGRARLSDVASRISKIWSTVEAHANALRFADSPGFGDHTYHVIEGHLRHPAAWQQIAEFVDADVGEPIIVVGTGDDGTNLQVALDVRRRYPSAHITVRSFRSSPFAKQVADAENRQLFELAELISKSMSSTWFESGDL